MLRKVSLATAALAALVALPGCARKSEAQTPPQAPPVSVASPLQREVVDLDEFVGRFEAPTTVQVRARVGGYVQAAHFREGQFVRQGQLLFTLDPRPAQAAVSAARAQLAQAEARYGLARADLRRAESLAQSQAVSQAELDQRRAGVRGAEADVSAAQANLRARQLDLEFTRVTAPASGRVSDRRVDAGNLVAGGSSQADVLTTIVSTSPIHFTFEASEAVLLKYQRQSRGGAAAPVRIRLQDEPSFTRSGRVDFSDNALDPSSGTIRIRAVVDNPDGFLKPGLAGRARVAGGGAYPALLVPDSAVATDQARKVVYVVARDGSVTPRPVQLGPLYDGLRVVRSGVGPNDRVIVAGLQRVMPGQKVTPRVVPIRPGQAAEGGAPVTLAAPAVAAAAPGAF